MRFSVPITAVPVFAFVIFAIVVTAISLPPIAISIIDLHDREPGWILEPILIAVACAGAIVIGWSILAVRVFS